MIKRVRDLRLKKNLVAVAHASENPIPLSPKDKIGRTFDPNLHAVKKDGTPRLSVKGNLILLPGNR